ncbi:hypothetical protein E4T49_03630 [Aureobasidium sp. EXF-10728]|nr:hypothetical protein E4T49_03630 [Aureobasidium sp. EXF-10728]
MDSGYVSLASLCGTSITSQLDKLHAPSSTSGRSIASQLHKLHSYSSTTLPLSQTDSNPVPPEQRRHPRRSQGNVLQKPPTLVRQEERKATFVDGLVDSAAQMVEVIWPLSVAPCKPQAGGVLSLRRYIEETLRRSRTSYSTLQVALYYLVLIMPCVPKSDFTMQQSVDSPSVRALQCGRRMFLAALILASKYLQDRNYSAKAWSKMSGLKVTEINTNERAFLEAVNWKLHLPEPLFKRWTEVVLRYTPGQAPPSAVQSKGNDSSDDEEPLTWKDIIPQLTPDLELVAPTASGVADRSRSESPISTYTTLPSYLEPQPEVRPPTPILGVSYLPTPRSTPPPALAPAVSIGSVEMCNVVGKFSRRSSFGSQVSSVLSPASMLSEGSRLSPASSVTSVGSFNSYIQDHTVKNPAVKSHTAFSTSQPQLTAYDAQPQASRAVKRSFEHISGSEEEERRGPLQTITCSLLNKHEGTKALPIVLDDEDCASNSMAAEVASLQAKSWTAHNNTTCMPEAKKCRRVAYGCEEPWADRAPDYGALVVN